MKSSSMTDPMTAAEFTALRHQLGLSQSQLGQLMGMRFQEISRIETKTGPTKIQAAFLRYIASHPPR